MRLRLGRIPYLNTEPFFGDDDVRAGARTAVPRAMVDLALAGQLDLGPLPAVAAFDHPGLLAPVGGLGIVAPHAATSVILRSRVRPEALHRARIGIIDDTATSVRLLKILLALRLELRGVRYGPIGPGCDALLIIGDRALRADGVPPEFAYTYDLGAEWRGWTGLPFCFALWMARTGTDPAELDVALRYLGENLDRNLADPAIIHRRRPDLGMSAAAIADYVRAFQYRLDDRAWQGLERFRELDARRSAQEDAA
ncbi:MAG: hypothetical protein FJ029_05180 [Actinobacteria bacterium]|nr:hypothetical protein [Actinomycetota bacterium]